MTFVLKAILEQTYMFYPMANFVNYSSFVFRFGKKKKKRKETLTKPFALSFHTPDTRYQTIPFLTMYLSFHQCKSHMNW